MSKMQKFALLVLFGLMVSLLPSSVIAAEADQQPTKNQPEVSAAPVMPIAVPAVTPNQPAVPSISPSTPTISGRPADLTFSELVSLLSKNPQSVSHLTFLNGSHEVVVEREGQKPVKIAIPIGSEQVLLETAAKGNVPVSALADSFPDWIQALLPFAMIIGIMVLMWWVSQRQQARLQGQMGQAQTVDARDPNAQVEKVTFRDVAGCDEAVEELRRVVRSIVGEAIYAKFGAELPRGILLMGPPGTGKTLLAKASAGETEGTIDMLSGSDFVQMYVGVGAARVRDAFNKGRDKIRKTGKPHILFIDELDAVGGKRGSGTGAGGHQEREQTLNAILVEMDGVKSNKGLIVIAATNRVDMLDEALLRQGRFDCHISVDLPDLAGREKIFAIHTRKKPLSPDASLALLASRTYGYSGAEIRGACNRAAIRAADRYKARVDQLLKEGVSPEEIEKNLPCEILLVDFDEGIDFVKYGGPRTSRQNSMVEEEKLNTAFHEAGHACATAAMSMIGASDPVVKITIMSRSRALGYVQRMPNKDRVSFTERQAIGHIVIAMAGRAAQEVYTNTVDTGASNDFEQATGMARMMVTKWGMSRLGHISVGERGDSPMGGPSGGTIAYGRARPSE